MIDKVKSISLPEANCKNTVIVLSVLGSGYFVYNYGKQTYEKATGYLHKLYNNENEDA